MFLYRISIGTFINWRPKMYSLPERYSKHVKEEAAKLQIAESEYLRRLIDKDIDNKKKND